VTTRGDWAVLPRPDPADLRAGAVCLGTGGRRRPGRARLVWRPPRHALVFVTTGRGELTAGGRRTPVVGPAAVWLPPSCGGVYGPDGAGWSELWTHFSGAAGDVPARPAVTAIADPAPVHAAFARLAAACAGPDAGAAAAAALRQVIVAVHRQGAPPRDPTTGILHALRNAAAMPWSIAQHAERVGLPVAQLRDAVAAATGGGPREYITGVRLKRATELLLTTELRVAAVAAAVGYRDQAYFTRVFTRHFGVSPARFRREAPQAARPTRKGLDHAS